MNGLPSANFEWEPASPVAGGSVDLVSTSSDFEGPLSSLSWDLDGDGLFGDGSEAQIRQPFPKAGTYDIGLQVTDSDGTVSTVRKQVVVAAPPAPKPPPTPPSGPTGGTEPSGGTPPRSPTPRTRLMSPFPVVRIAGTVLARRSPHRRAVGARSARFPDTSALRRQGLPGRLGGHHERHPAGQVPEVRAQAEGGNPHHGVRAAGEQDREVHPLPDPRRRAAEARGSVPAPDTPLPGTLPVTRRWIAGAAALAFVGAFLVASVAVGGEADQKATDRSIHVRLSAVAKLPAIAKDPALVAERRAARRERLRAKRVRAKRVRAKRRRAAARRAAARETAPAVPEEIPLSKRAARARGATPSGGHPGSPCAPAAAPGDVRRFRMRLATKDLPPLELVEDGPIDGYVVEGSPVRYGERELIYDAVGPDGEAVSLVMAVSPMRGRHGRSQFRRSARTRAGLQHSALLPVRAVGTHDGRPYLATDPYPAETFADLLDRSALSPKAVLTLLAPVCNALDLAGANGLVHQNLSSTSILLDDSGALVLDAFGVAGGAPKRSAMAWDIRDVRYTPPEELYGVALSPASNVYSLACLLVESFSDESGPRRTYAGSRVPAADGTIGGAERRSLGLGVAVDEVIGRGLAMDRHNRPSSAGELLSEVADALGIALPAPEAELPVRSSVRRRHRALPRPRGSALLVGAIIVALVAGLAAGAVIDPLEEAPSAAGPSADVQALKRLDNRRAPIRAALSASSTPDEQAAAAAELAAAYGRAARAAESSRVASAARAAELAYEELGGAAEAGAGERFTAAAEAVTRAEAQLAAAATQAQ